MSDELAKKILDDMADQMVIGIDLATGDDKSVAVGALVSADGTIRIIGHKEFYAESEPDYDIDLTAQDVSEQRALPKPDQTK